MENPFEIIIERLDNIEKLLLELSSKISNPTDPEKLMGIDELSEYLKLAKPTIYQKTGSREMPSIKIGKRLYFKKSDIDNWLIQGRRKSNFEIQEEAAEFVRKHPRKF
jgi:excisionase family DNA binding protein